MKNSKLLPYTLAVLIFVSMFWGIRPVEAATSGDYSYTVNTDNTTCTITGYTGAVGDITIPSKLGDYTVTSIGAKAFKGCGLNGSITFSVTIPNSVTSIGDSAFYYCYVNSVAIPNSVTSIGASAFSNSFLNSVMIPNSVTTIGAGAFKGCDFLTSITIPNSVTTIEDFTFANCSPTTVTIPNSVTTIGASAFDGCFDMTSLTIANSVTSIGDRAFAGCGLLTSLTIPNSVTSIGTYAFTACDRLTNVTIPNSVTTIGDRAFYYCIDLASVTISNGVTTIGDYAFANCLWLTSVTIPNSVTTIGDHAFYNCIRLTSVTIPNSVTTLEDGAFSSCNVLTSVYFDGSMPTIDGAFYGPLPTFCCPTGNPGNITFPPITVTEFSTKIVTSDSTANGTITPSTNSGMPGETISLNIIPADGYRPVSGSLKYNDDDGIHSINGTSFIMSGSAVTISGEFEKMPAPEVSVTPNTSMTSNRRPVWSWTDATGAGYYRYKLSGVTAWTYSTAVSYSPAADLSDGVYTLYVQEMDSGGYWSGSSASITVDTTAPATGYSVSFDQTIINSANQSSASFSFANAELGSTYNFIVSDGTNSISGSNTISSVTQQITEINLASLSDGTLTLNATLTDESGNIGTAVPDTVSKDSASPVWSADAALTVTNKTVNGFTLNWPAATDNIGMGNYKVFSDGNLITTVAGNEFSCNVAGLAPGESHTYQVEAVDSAVNTANGPSLAADSNTLMTVGLGSIPKGLAGETYSIALTAGGGKSPYTYSASGFPTGLSINGSTGVINGTPTAQGLSTVTAAVYDSLCQQINITFDINIEAPDTTAPVWPADAALTVTDKSLNAVTLHWPQATDNTGVSGYRIYRNGSLVTTVAGSADSCSVAGLIQGVSYTFKVEAFDTAGNVSSELTDTASTASTPGIDASNITTATLGNIYSASLTAGGGTGPYTWSAAGLPAGLSLNTSTGAITGTPTVTGTLIVNVTLTDSLGNTTSKGFTLSVFYPAGTGKYIIVPSNDTAYTAGTTSGGITTLTVNSGVTGFKYFTVNVEVTQSHTGNEVAVFVQMRNGVQIAINATKTDFDQVNSAMAAFNVQTGDIIKVYIVDELTNDAGSNPTLLQ